MTCILASLLFGAFTFLVGFYRGAKIVNEEIIDDIEVCGCFRIKKIAYKAEVMK